MLGEVIAWSAYVLGFAILLGVAMADYRAKVRERDDNLAP